MGGRIIGSAEGISARLGIEGGRIRKSINDQIQKEAEIVLKIAKDMVPMEFGHAESAIKLAKESQRRLWTVYIDEDTPADGPKKGEMSGRYTVGDYILFLHEGDYALGDESRAKQRRVRWRVGRKFLERAFTMRVREGMIRRIAAAARREGVI